jgi:hypothetical protein
MLSIESKKKRTRDGGHDLYNKEMNETKQVEEIRSTSSGLKYTIFNTGTVFK